MRLIPVEYLKEGSEVAINVMNADNKLLLSKGQMISKRIMERLEEKGVSYVYITDEYCFNEVSDSIADIQGFLRSILKLKRLARRVTDGTSDASDMEYAIGISKEVIQAARALDDSVKIRYEPTKLIINSVEEETIYIAIMAVILGVRMGYSEEKLINLCLATLLKDLALLSPKIKDKGEVVKRMHPLLTCQYLESKYDVSEELMRAILHHHENYDGTGYPHGLRGGQISELAQVINIVDSFYRLKSSHDMLTGTHGMLEANLKRVFMKFDLYILSNFMGNIEVFTLDTMVCLNNGDIGVVVQNNYTDPFKPVIKIIRSSRFEEGEIVNLEKEPKLGIKHIEYYAD